MRKLRTFNNDFDNNGQGVTGTAFEGFEIISYSVKKITYTCLVKMRTNALWAAEVAWANGIHSEAIRYYKILNRIERAMWDYPSRNELIA